MFFIYQTFKGTNSTAAVLLLPSGLGPNTDLTEPGWMEAEWRACWANPGDSHQRGVSLAYFRLRLLCPQNALVRVPESCLMNNQTNHRQTTRFISRVHQHHMKRLEATCRSIHPVYALTTDQVPDRKQSDVGPHRDSPRPHPFSHAQEALRMQHPSIWHLPVSLNSQCP